MINQDRIRYLEQEASLRRSRLAQLRKELRAASGATMSSSSMNGDNLVAIAGAVRAAELSVEGIERDLAEARRPKRVVVTGSRASLEERRRQLVQKLDYMRAGRKQAEERVLATSDPRYVKQWRQVLLNNAGLTAATAQKQEAPLLEEIDHIAAQLAELDRREAARGPDEAA